MGMHQLQKMKHKKHIIILVIVSIAVAVGTFALTRAFAPRSTEATEEITKELEREKAKVVELVFILFLS